VELTVQKILVCDDNPAITKSLAEYFTRDGFEVKTAGCGNAALDIFRENDIELIILDVMLPDISGLDVCKEIRKKSEIPILMLSAKGEELDRVIGLEIGADDYVTKPFSIHEVLVRCKKLLRRSETNPQQKKYEIAELVIYPDAFEAFVSGVKLQLTSKEFLCLKYLAGHVGKVVSRDHIINVVWGTEYIGEPRIVDTLITRLRRKVFFDPSANLHFNLITVFGAGYKLEVEE
jgi:DNA-binding response OmpR family regulator